MIPHEIKLLVLASNCIFYFATADGKESEQNEPMRDPIGQNYEK
jgi:hypothetical protein